VEVAAGSPWSLKRDNSGDVDLPDNVRVRRRSYQELKELYATSLFTVVPLVENDMQAGITTIVESMAMGRPVVVSRTRGQVGTVLDGVNGLEVPPGDPGALRRAITWMLEHPEECARMGIEARRRVSREMSMERFVERMSEVVAEVGGQPQPEPPERSGAWAR
jgi:glycosyltransferase involved in cell wall biosynthesis